MPSDQHQQLLACFDPVGLERYGIMADELQGIERYICLLQSGLGETVWDEAVQIGGAYGTSILIREIVEIRTLQQLGIDPYRYAQAELARVLSDHLVAHVAAVYEEHLYLQDVLLRRHGCHFEVATLIKANRADDMDLNYLLESDVGVFLLEQDRVEEARTVLEQLKQE
ncbi:MAG: hypothetical protein JW850_04100 [Thermoflexales bacterium]|nr:hypothetical protein [Thermoflexales bacterium]